MEEDGPETPFGARSLQTEQEDNWTIESGEGKREMNKDDKDLAQQLEAESKNSRVETCMRDGDDEMADGDCTDGGNLGVSGEVDKCGGKMAKPNLTISPIATDMAYLSDNCSHNYSFSPRSFNLALSSDSTPQKTQAGTSPCTTINTLKSSPFRGALTVPDKSRRHRNLRGWPIFPGVPILSEFQSQVLLAFLESRSEADAASPPYEDCEALGREVGLTEGEVRKWLSNARNAKERQKAAGTQNRCSGARYTKHARENENDDDDDDDHEENVLTIVESESSGSQAMDLSSSGAKKRREIQGDSGLTSDSDNEEVYTSVIVSDEDSQSVPMREEPESPAQEETQKEPIGDKGSGGGKVLRSTTVFLSDAEDEDDEEEEGGAPKPKRKKRKRELEPEEIKRERLDPDVDLELEAQADPPNPLPLTMDHPGLPGGILHSLSLSLAPFSTQFISPYVLSLPSSMVGLGVAEGGGGKGPAFPNPPHITRFSDHLITSPLSYSHTSQYLSNGGDGESALDLSMGSKHGSKATSSTSTLVDRTSVQKGRLLDGLGLRPTAKGLIVVQVKPDSAGNTSASNSGGFVNSNNMSKPSTVYMRAAERMSATILEREKERAKEQEREKDKDPRRPKGKRYRDMRRSRTIIQAEQLDVLYGCYFKDPNPGKNEFEQISEWVHLPKKVVQIWFQNMRARERKGEVRFVSDGTLAAVGKPLIKFTWPLSKPIFNSLPKTNSSGTPAATSVRPLVKQVTEKEQAKKEMEIVKTPNQVPLKSTETATSTVASMSSSVSAVPKIKLETTSNTTMVKIAPKVTPPIVPAVPKESLSSPSGLLQKCKVEVESENEEKTDEEDAQKEESIGPVTANRMVPRMTSTPVTKPPAAVAVSQKQNGLNYWSSKGPFKINTLSREQLGLPSPPVKPRTITPAPLHTMPTTAPATSTSTTASSGTDAPATTTAAAAAAARVPKPTEAILHHANSRRPRTHLSCLQLSILQSCYETCAHPNALECEAIGTELGLPLKVVQIWFQNTRAKEKRWRLQQEKVQSPSSDPSKKIDTSSGSYLQYNALRANRPILPKPVQLTVVEPSSPPVAGQPAPRETLRGRCEACNVGFQSRAAARAHVFSPRHLATLRTTNFGQPATAAVVNNNGSVTGSSSVTGSGGETVEPSPPPASSTS